MFRFNYLSLKCTIAIVENVKAENSKKSINYTVSSSIFFISFDVFDSFGLVYFLNYPSSGQKL